jgi:hypothetical protein
VAKALFSGLKYYVDLNNLKTSYSAEKKGSSPV